VKTALATMANLAPIAPEIVASTSRPVVMVLRSETGRHGTHADFTCWTESGLEAARSP
jgi:hypothetical protein